MWIVATVLEFQETEPESPVAEGNMQAQNIIFHVYCTCCFPFIFAARASWQEEQHQQEPMLLCRGQCWHCHTDGVCPRQCCGNWEPACADSEHRERLADGCSTLHHRPLLVKKRHIILGETGKLCDSYYIELMLNNFNFENFKSMQYFIDMFLHNTLKMTNSIWWGGINAYFI